MIPVNWYFYFLIFIGVMIMLVRLLDLKRIIKDSKNVIIWACFILVFGIMVYQTLRHMRYFLHAYQLYSKKNQTEKLTYISRFPFQFAQGAKAVLPGYYTGRLITDIDIKQEPGMLIHRALAYYLYPQINIRSCDKSRKPEVLVYFQKQNAHEHIPLEYMVVYMFNEKNFIAIKK